MWLKVNEASEVITESILRNVDAMVSLTRIKQHDPYTAMHCMNVCTLVVAVAKAEGIDAATLPMITTATLLHDVGKTRVPLEVLNKPGRFEPEELEVMRQHATFSGDIMREEGGFPEEAIAIATQHHEMMDGSGYPGALKGDEIHPYARMTAVADVYDALTAKRVYKPAMPMHQALMRIHKNKGTETRGLNSTSISSISSSRLSAYTPLPASSSSTPKRWPSSTNRMRAILTSRQSVFSPCPIRNPGRHP